MVIRPSSGQDLPVFCSGGQVLSGKGEVQDTLSAHVGSEEGACSRSVEQSKVVVFSPVEERRSGWGDGRGKGRVPDWMVEVEVS
jgi:hypothetical protein